MQSAVHWTSSSVSARNLLEMQIYGHLLNQHLCGKGPGISVLGTHQATLVPAKGSGALDCQGNPNPYSKRFPQSLWKALSQQPSSLVQTARLPDFWPQSTGSLTHPLGIAQGTLHICLLTCAVQACISSAGSPKEGFLALVRLSNHWDPNYPSLLTTHQHPSGKFLPPWCLSPQGCLPHSLSLHHPVWEVE